MSLKAILVQIAQMKLALILFVLVFKLDKTFSTLAHKAQVKYWKGFTKPLSPLAKAPWLSHQPNTIINLFWCIQPFMRASQPHNQLPIGMLASIPSRLNSENTLQFLLDITT